MKKIAPLSLVVLAAVIAVGIFAAARPDGPPGKPALFVNDQAVPLSAAPPDPLSASEAVLTLEQTNHLSLSYQDGVYAPQGQLLIRLAREEDGVIHTSRFALIYNFTPDQRTADLSLQDLLDLDADFDYTLVQFELISFWESQTSGYQFALARVQS